MLSFNLVQTFPQEKIQTGLELLRRWGRYIKEIHRTEGEYDYIVELETKNEAELRKVLKKHHNKLHVARIRTMIAD